MSLRFLAGALERARSSPASRGWAPTSSPRGLPAELRGEDGVRREKVIVIDDPFGHEDDEVVLLPALTPDVSSSTPSR